MIQHRAKRDFGKTTEPRGKASTEELRQALLHFRRVFEDLGGERTDVPNAITTAAEIAPPRPTPEREVIREEERPRA